MLLKINKMNVMLNIMEQGALFYGVIENNQREVRV
jgi:hypothetical protein